MPASFRETFVIFALIGVFVFASISFIVKTQTDNSVTRTILEDGIINRTYVDLESNLNSTREQVQTQKDSFESENPERGFGSLIIFSIVGVGKTFAGMTLGVYNIFIVLPSEVLGIPRIVVGVFTAILVVSLILLVWRVYRSGA